MLSKILDFFINQFRDKRVMMKKLRQLVAKFKMADIASITDVQA